MTELWITSVGVVSWVLAAGLVGIAGSFLVRRRHDLASQASVQGQSPQANVPGTGAPAGRGDL